MVFPAPITIQQSANKQNLASISISNSWRPLVEEACVLKEALDHASRWKRHGSNQQWIEKALHPLGLSICDFSNVSGTTGFPDSFAKVLLGSWVFPDGAGTDYGQGLVPEWAVMGWVRKDCYQHTPSIPTDQLAQHARKINKAELADPDALIHGFQGIPLYFAREGKNRTQLYRLARVSRVCQIRMYEEPRLEGAVVRPVAFLPWMNVLDYGNGQFDLLPFGDLSRRMLGAFGVNCSNRPSVRVWFSLRDTIDRQSRRSKKVSWIDVLKMLPNRRELVLALLGMHRNTSND